MTIRLLSDGQYSNTRKQTCTGPRRGELIAVCASVWSWRCEFQSFRTYVRVMDGRWSRRAWYRVHEGGRLPRRFHGSSPANDPCDKFWTRTTVFEKHSGLATGMFAQRLERVGEFRSIARMHNDRFIVERARGRRKLWKTETVTRRT